MFEKIWSLKETLDAITGGDNTARFIAMGDLNTMGRSRSGEYSQISGEQEIEGLKRDAQDNGMKLLSKNYKATWRRGSSDPDFESNLDHGIATPNLSFESIENPTDGRRAEIGVDGWNHLAGDEKEDFTENISDHCSILLKIE
jgi:hypothetical protein